MELKETQHITISLRTVKYFILAIILLVGLITLLAVNFTLNRTQVNLPSRAGFVPPSIPIGGGQLASQIIQTQAAAAENFLQDSELMESESGLHGLGLPMLRDTEFIGR